MVFDWSRYNKLIAAVVGNIVGILLVWLATKTPLAQCTMVGTEQTCTLLGMSQETVIAAVLTVINAVAVAVAPKNSVTPQEAVKEAEAARDADGTKVVQKVELNPQSRDASKINVDTGPTVTVGTPGAKP